MTKREAAIVACFTGKFLGDFSTFHAMLEEIMERPVWTHEIASKEFNDELRIKARHYFSALEVV